jgi:hypothetical protein
LEIPSKQLPSAGSSYGPDIECHDVGLGMTNRGANKTLFHQPENSMGTSKVPILAIKQGVP